MLGLTMLTQISGLTNRLLSPLSGLSATWFNGWHPVLDEALQSLPEAETCPHELFRLLIQNPSPVRKLSVLVTKQGAPVAVAGLRQKGRYSWEPITQWILPGTVFPVKPDYLIPSLEAIGSEVWVAWWRMESSPPPSRMMRCLESTPTYRLHFSADYESYWRESGHWNTVRRCRKRCSDFTLVVNAPGSAEWTIANWEAHWRTDPTVVDPSVSDRIVAAKYLENQGRHYSFWLLDQQRPVAGHTFIRHHNDLVWQVTYRDPSYDWHGAGTRLMDLAFSWAALAGFQTIDMGGQHEYKIRWAPEEGERWWFSVCPEPLYSIKQAVNWARGLRGTGTN